MKASDKKAEGENRWSEQLEGLKSVNRLIDFLRQMGKSHKRGYFHYTTVKELNGILQSNRLYLSNAKRQNDLLEAEHMPRNVYSASFSFGPTENIAMWNVYGMPIYDAVRLRFGQAEFVKLVDAINGKRVSINWVRNDDQLGDHLPASLKVKAELTDVAYVYGHSLLWNKAIHPIQFSGQSVATTTKEGIEVYHPGLKGRIKTSTWAYENEVRLLVTIGKDGQQRLPSRIAIDIAPLLKQLKVVGGPCLSVRALKQVIRPNGNDEIVKRVQQSVLFRRFVPKVCPLECPYQKKDCHLFHPNSKRRTGTRNHGKGQKA